MFKPKTPPAPATKKCPYCAETIQAAAVVCRYCRRDVTPNGMKWAQVNAQAARSRLLTNALWQLGCGLIALGLMTACWGPYLLAWLSSLIYGGN